MESTLLTRFEVEKIANCLLPKMVTKEKDGYIVFDFTSLEICYDVEYRKDKNGRWLLFDYVPTSLLIL